MIISSDFEDKKESKERRGELTENVMDELESEGEAMSEDDDFLASDDEDENEDPEERRRRRRERRKRQNITVNYENYEDAAAIYNDDWLQDAYDPDDEGLFDDSEFAAGGPLRIEGVEGESREERGWREAKKFSKSADPEALRELFLTDLDEKIRLTDLPERFQLSFPNRAVPSEEELAKESAWISDLLFSSSSMLDLPSLTLKVRTILGFLLESHLEVSFIEHYRKDQWAPSLSSSDLWKIAELDHQWHSLQSRKNALRRALPNDDEIIASDPRLSDIQTRLDIASNEDTVQDLSDYYNFHYGHRSKKTSGDEHISSLSSSGLPSSSSAPPPLEDVVETDDPLLDIILPGEKPSGRNEKSTKNAMTRKNPSRARPVRSDARAIAEENNLDRFWTHLSLKPSELAMTVRAWREGKKREDEISNIDSFSPSQTPLEAASSFISPPSFNTAQSVLDGARTLYAAELAAHPQFRAKMAEYFDIHGVVSTKATQTGEIYIDLKHMYANVRHLVEKPVSSFRDSSLFLVLLKAVEEGLIQVSFTLPKSEMDKMRREMAMAFGVSEEMASEMSLSVPIPSDALPSQHWAIYKMKIIAEAISIVMPKLVARRKAKMFREATQVVLEESERNLEQMIRVGPVRIPQKVASSKRSASTGGRKSGKKETTMAYDSASSDKSPTIASICVEDPSTKARETSALVTIVDEHGEIKEVLQVLASLRVEDSIALREMFRKHMPFAIAVGIDTPMAKKFMGTIGEMAKAFQLEEALDSPIDIYPMPLDLASVYQTTRKAEKEFNPATYSLPTQESIVMLRRCASVARRLIDPLLAFSGIMNPSLETYGTSSSSSSGSDFALMGLNIHSLQKFVAPHLLRRRLEHSFVRVVSEVGVDVNRILGHGWMQSVLQFVPGMGARKASSLLDGLLRGDARVDSRTQLQDSALESQLRPGEYLAHTVYNNAIAFLKICGSDSLYIRDWDPLDGTRIHPAQYPIAAKIGNDLIAMGHVNQSKHEHYASAISRSPDLLKFVDVAAIINHVPDKAFAIQALVEELKAPFVDLRIFSPFSMADLFDFVVGKGNLVPGSLVTVKATFQDRQTQTWEVSLPSFIDGSISGPDAPFDLRRGQSVQAQVIGVDKELFRCHLTCNISSQLWDAFLVENRDAWLMPENSSSSSSSSNSSKAHDRADPSDPLIPSLPSPSIFKKNIVHRYFANKSREEAEEALSSKPLHSFLIHPTTNKNRLTITFKSYFDKYAHMTVEEEYEVSGEGEAAKTSASASASASASEPSSLKIDGESFDNVDDLVVRFVEPIIQNIKELEQAPCFMKMDKAQMNEKLIDEKRSNPSRSPYHIAPSQDHPGFFVLYYIPGTQTVRKEVVKVSPNGFRYRSLVFSSVNRLIAYFKKNYNDPKYLQRQQQERQQREQLAQNQQNHNDIPLDLPFDHSINSYGSSWPSHQVSTGNGYNQY